MVLVADSQRAVLFQLVRVRKMLPDRSAVYVSSGREVEAMALDPVLSYKRGDKAQTTLVKSTCLMPHVHDPDPRSEEALKLRKEFAFYVADQMNKEYKNKHYDRLILAAPAKMIGDLRERFYKVVRQSIVAVLPKDLLALDARSLMKHLHDTLIEAQRP